MLRQLIQQKLSEIPDIEVSTELPDEMLEENKVYFSYLLQNNISNADFDNNGIYRVTIIGYIKIKFSMDIDSLQVVDNAQIKIKNKLKELNFKTSFNDVSVIDNIRKIQVSSYATYYELNNGLM